MTKNDEALRLANDAQGALIQAAAMIEDIPHVENRDRALRYLADGLEKLTHAVQVLAGAEAGDGIGPVVR
jgi:hypothetical protein